MTNFSKRVYSLVLQVPPGQVTTYKALAKAMGTKAYQAVGQVLKCNPHAPHIPCHRVVKADGSLGGFMGQRQGKFVMRKADLLSSEGIKIEKNKIKDFNKILFTEFECRD
jgi:methylated-DNA-[protein]-cysteine S-methyltransferase